MVKIRTRLIASFLLVSLLPLMAVSYVALQALESMRATTTRESSAALAQLGEQAVQSQAQSVARQVDLYLEAHPALATGQLQADKELAALAVQPVGKTGYTAVYDDRGIVYFHADPSMVNRDMHELADALPAFWNIYRASLDGSPSAGYYEWQDANGVKRDKYMSTARVGSTAFRVAGTTYIDEFSQPIQVVESKINAISEGTLRLLLAALFAVAGITGVFGFWLAANISRPISRLTTAAELLERGRFQPDRFQAERARKDDLGQLARTFHHMAREVLAREEQLEHEVQALRIEIDQSKKERQVAEIVESEYFQTLYEKAQGLKSAGAPEPQQRSGS